MPPTSLPRVVLKFKDVVQLPYRDDIGDDIEQGGFGAWNQLKTQFPGIRIRRLYQQLDPSKIQALIDRAVTNDPTYTRRNLLAYFLVEFPPSTSPQHVADVLKTWPSVETAYPDRIPVLAAQACSMGYASAAVTGIDADFARTVPGGDGAGQALIDLEGGWTFNHVALAAHAIPVPVFGVVEPADVWHGTAVLGIICGDELTTKFAGIVPKLQSVRVASYLRAAGELPSMSTVAEAIAVAADQLIEGNVLLVEVATPDFLPCEADPACFDNINVATSAGVVVVEPAANGGTNLDTYNDAAGAPLFDPTFRDSGAILVASADSAGNHPRRRNSNYGARINCFAWGDSTFTAVSANLADTASFSPPCFNDTSAAAAIIAGAALAVQGMAEANGGARFKPTDLRDVLADTKTGTAPAALDAGLIGIMPDLRAIATQVLGVVERESEAPEEPTNLRIVT